MKPKKKALVLGILVLAVAVCAFSVLAYLQWVGRPVQTELALSVIPEGEEAPSSALTLRLDGRLKLRVFSYALQQFEGTAVLPGFYEPDDPPKLSVALFPDRTGTIAGAALAETPFPFQRQFFWDGHDGLVLLPDGADPDPERTAFYTTGGRTRMEILRTWYGR